MTSTTAARLHSVVLVAGIAATTLSACSGGADEKNGADGGGTESVRVDPDADGGSERCVPDAYVFCRCEDGGKGVKKCVEGHFDPCICQ